MELPVKIIDDFEDLSPLERSESMTRSLSQFDERMIENNGRVLRHVIDLITANETDEDSRLHMLATHIARENNQFLDFVPWSEYAELYPGVTRLEDFFAEEGCEAGTIPPTDTVGAITLLSDLQEAVRKNASRGLLGSIAAETLKLPTDYCEFAKHAHNISSSNWDRTMFYCEFGATFFSANIQARPLDELLMYNRLSGFEVAAGWQAGGIDSTSSAYYLLCREGEEPWQWRIVFSAFEFAEQFIFNSLDEFLRWYGNAYDWVRWDIVEVYIGQLQRVCKKARLDIEEEEEEEEVEEEKEGDLT